MTRDYLTREYYRAGRKQEVSWPAVEPVPEVTTRDRAPSTPPQPVIKLQRAAEGAGWAAEIGYSRGPERAVRVGTYKMTEAHGLYVPAHPSTGWRFIAIYHHTVGKPNWQWRISIRRPGQLVGPGLGAVFTHATITDLAQFVTARGDVGTPWFKAVQARVEEQLDRTRAAARARPRGRKEGTR